MAKRGRPRKRGGLIRSDASPRVALRDVAKDVSSSATGLDPLPVIAEEVVVRLGSKSITKVEGEGSMLKVSRKKEWRLKVTTGSAGGLSGSDNGLGGASMMGKSVQLQKQETRGKGVIQLKDQDEDWQMVRQRSGSARGLSTDSDKVRLDEVSGSRFSILGDDGNSLIALQSLDEIVAEVDMQLGSILAPFPSPIT
ncbi:hypothetical protein Dimus_001988 [Dionaea muscipula]